MFLCQSSSISVLAQCFAIWFVLNWLNFQAQGLVLSEKTIRKARCVANCYTMYGEHKNDSERICQIAACEECLLPCGKTQNETFCIKECNNSKSCEASCKFLTHLKNLSSILTGDGSKLPTPSTPTLRDRTFTSITLQWEPVNSTNGTAVYMVAVELSGDTFEFSFVIDKVVTVPRITIDTSSLCTRVTGSGTPRLFFNGINYKYHVAVLTENSSISYGAKTTKNLIPLVPQPVSNITVNIVYVANPPPKKGKLKLTTAWKQPREEEQVISSYAMVWSEDVSCPRVFFEPMGRQSTITSGPDTSGILYIDEKIKKCSKELLTVYALNSCLVSSGTTLTFEYPGNYYLPECVVSFAAARAAGYSWNLTPIAGCANITHFPKEECYKMDPPDAPDEDKQVRNVTHGLFAINDDYTFNMRITWEPPRYPYLNVSKYFLYWQHNFDGFSDVPSGSIETQKTSAIVGPLRPGEEYIIYIISDYSDKEFTISISGTINITFRTQEVDPAQVTVRDLKLDKFIFSEETKTFHLNVTWQRPSFNYSEISAYVISYQVNNRTMVLERTNKTYFNIPGIVYGAPVAFYIAPRYIHKWVKGNLAKKKTMAKMPPADELEVQNLRAGISVENKENNTFAVNFTWDPPSFKYRDVLHYNLSYVVSGLLRNQFPCKSILVNTRCTIIGFKETFFQISGILPQEHITMEVTPVFNDRYIKGHPFKNEDYNAPAPRGELLKVVQLSHDELVPTSSSFFRTTVRWQKPLFTHSNVSYYTYKITKKNGKEIQRRAISFNAVNKTTRTTVLIDGINLNEEIEFQVTPVFVTYTVIGIEDKLTILKTNEPTAKALSEGMTPGEISGLVIGLLLLAVISLMVSWCLWKERKIRKEKGIDLGKNGVLIDHWEVDGDLVALEDEIGEGAFGKVYRGTLKKMPNPSQMLLLKSSRTTSRTINGSETYVVAVKMLQNMSDNDQRREFLDEIQLMKAVGSHRNIVNMIGCCTVVEPMFLLVEYVPYGDLLHYLRKHREKVTESLGDKLSGPYHSTYCETYFMDTKSEGISMKAHKDDHVYVNAPWMSKEDGAVELLSFNTSIAPEDGIQHGEENKGLDASADDTKEIDRNEEILTPGDLMAFAWQITQGMEYLSKEGFVHRDLAARNVLVGENKIAKIADFGLTRYVYEEKVYQAKRNRKLPLKWMSIEAIFDQTFTVQSDVWAFGVVLWEIVTLGGTPYPSIDNKELLRLLKNGYRMEKPDTCNDELYEMMQNCWQESPEKRSNFTQLRECLETMMQKDNPYLDLTAVDESRAYYNVPSFNSVTEMSADSECDSDVEVVAQGSAYNPNEVMREKDLPSIRQSMDIRENDNENQQTENSCCTKDSRVPLDVVINLNNLERSIYRTAGQGMTF